MGAEARQNSLWSLPVRVLGVYRVPHPTKMLHRRSLQSARACARLFRAGTGPKPGPLRAGSRVPRGRGAGLLVTPHKAHSPEEADISRARRLHT